MKIKRKSVTAFPLIERLGVDESEGSVVEKIAPKIVLALMFVCAVLAILCLKTALI